jgi:hypothetical protein
MAQLWTGLGIPPGFDDFSRWPASTAEEARTFRRMARGDRLIMKISTRFPPVAGAGEKARYLWSLVFLTNPSIAGPGEKARYLWSLAFPPASYMRQTYPPPYDWMLPLSYLYRVVKYARGR